MTRPFRTLPSFLPHALVHQWPLISGANLTSPRTEVPLGSDGSEANLDNGTAVQALVRADGYKLIIGALNQNIWCVSQRSDIHKF